MTSNVVTGTAGDALVAQYAPTVSGMGVAGQTLTVAPGTWPGSPRLTYQWFRNATPIGGATRTTYVVTAADAAARLYVVETATLTGRLPGTSASPGVSVAKLRSTTALSLSAPRTTITKRVTATAQVAVSGLAAPHGQVTFYDGSRKLKRLSLGSRTLVILKLPRLKAGKHQVKAVYSGASQTQGSSRKTKLVVTKR